MFFKEDTYKKWNDFWKQVDEFDERITHTNPFSEKNYSQKKYTTFHEYYQPKAEHVVIWVDDD